MARYVTKELLEVIKGDARKRWAVGSCQTCLGGSIAVALGLEREQMYPCSWADNRLPDQYLNFITEFAELAEIEFPLVASNIGYWNDRSTFSEVMQAIERAESKL